MSPAVPVAGTVHEVSLPDLSDAHIVGVEGEVDTFGVADPDGSGSGVCDEVTVDGGFSVRGGDEHSARAATSSGSGARGKRLLLHSRSGPFYKEALLSTPFEVADLNFSLTGFEANLPLGGFGWVHSVVVHHPGVVDIEARTIIGCNREGVDAIFWAFNVPGEDEAELVVPVFWAELKKAAGKSPGLFWFHLGKVGELVPLAVIELVSQVGHRVGSLGDRHHSVH